jgi:glycosyltransferase involved in cell wall biosynthesis
VTEPTKYKIAEAIYSVISDGYLHERFSRNCRETVQSAFSIDAVATQIEKIYDDVTNNKCV